MLRSSVCDIAADIAETLLRNHKEVVLINNTPLAELVRLSPYAEVMPYQDPIAGDPNHDPIKRYIGTPPITSSEHDLLQDRIIDMVSNSINYQLSFIKNEIVPTIDSIYEEVNKMMYAYMNDDWVSKINIVQLDISDFLNSDEFNREAEKYKGVIPVRPEFLNLKNEVYNNEDLLNRVRLAATDYYGENTTSVMENINNIDNSTFPAFLYDLTNPTNKVKNHEIISESLNKYLFVNTLMHNEDLALDIFDVQNINQLRQALGSAKSYLVSLLAMNKDILKSRSDGTFGMVVSHIDNETNTIFVNGPTYRKYIEDGNDNSTLFALLIDSNATIESYTYASLVQSKERLQSLLRQYLELAKTRKKLNIYNNFIETMRLVFYHHNQDKSKFESEYIETNPGTSEEIKSRLEKELSKLVLGDIETSDNMYKTIMKIVTQARYFYTDSYAILKYMETESNEDTDPETSATIAVIYYLVDYFMEQFRLL